MSTRCSLPKVQKRNLHRQNEFSLSRMLAGAEKEEKIWVCPQGHTFDIAAKGYVNLLMSNSSGAKRHGDDRLMINARRDFLSKGFYEPLREAVYEALSADFPRGGTLLDAGCGECWYTSYFKSRLDESGLEPQVLGVDISKYALEKAPKTAESNARLRAYISCPWATENATRSSIYSRPPARRSFRACSKRRSVRQGNTARKAFVGVKNAVYDAPYENEVPPHDVEGFRLVGEEKICYTLRSKAGRI